jgi:hypothetical protein
VSPYPGGVTLIVAVFLLTTTATISLMGITACWYAPLVVYFDCGVELRRPEENKQTN